MNISRHLVFCCGLIICLFGLSVSNAFSQTSENPTPQIAQKTIQIDSPKTENLSKPDETAAKTAPNSNALHRVGVQSGQTMPLSLDEAIRKALENNNDIEVVKNDVKIA